MKNIIIVPSWIQRLLARENRSIKEVLNYSKLCELVAPADMRALILLQSYGPFTEYHITDSDSTALLNTWKKNLSPQQLDELNVLVTSGQSTQLDKDHLKHLISGETRNDDCSKGFEVIPGDHYTLLLVLKDGYFGDQDYETQDANVIENIIRVLYGEFVQEDVARTSIFRRYVRNLGKQHIG